MTVAQQLGPPAVTTLREALERAALEPRAGVRFVDRRETPTWKPWAEILEGALEVAAGLREIGVRRGDRLGLVFSTSPELLEAFFGASLAGAVPACLSTPPRLGRPGSYLERTRRMLASAEAKAVLAQERLASRLADLYPHHLGCHSLSDLPRVESERPLEIEVEESDLAMVQFTSGTTRAPVPVGLSHGAVLGQARLLNANWPNRAGHVHKGSSWLPLHHDMGLIGCVFTALERPGEVTLLQPEVFAARPSLWLRAISTYGATVSAASNFAYAYCTERIRDDELDGVDLSCWRVALNGAEPVRARTLRRFAERFSRWGFDTRAMTPVYGLAEAGLGVTFAEIEEPFRSRRFDRGSLGTGCEVRESPAGVELVSVGRPLPGFELAIRDLEGADLAEGTVGRIWLRGPTLMSGYLDQSEAGGLALRDGWLDTGDQGFIYRDELYVSGRAKETLIVRGRNHSPAEVEHAAEDVAGVAVGGTAAVSLSPEEGEHEEVFLFVERTRRLSAAGTLKLQDDCRKSVLAETGLEVDHVVVLPRDGIARTSSGKVRRAETLERYLSRGNAAG